MLFNSIEYLIFLPVVLCLFWMAPKWLRPLILLVSSYYFYMSWKASYGLLLAGLTAANFGLGLLLARVSGDRRRLVFVAGLALNLGCLALFKYTNFLLDSLWSVLCHIPVGGMTASSQAPELPIILPLGISFFVFEFVHYLSDIYRGAEPIRSPLRFGVFAAFFPSQIAGPIKRFEDFDPQLVKLQPPTGQTVLHGLWLVVRGMFKKVALGDNLAYLVQAGFSSCSTMGTLDAWICVAAFTLQIYFDFSGYTDIGRGSALLFGFHLPENFNLPYIARNLQDFWHRWHISLSTWLRDYLFIPLGGSRGGGLLTVRNLMITMLLGGLWHGAAWHFVVWGAFHGIGLAVTHVWKKVVDRHHWLSVLRETLVWNLSGRLVTLLVVMLGWVVFRADNMQQAMGVYQAMFSWRTGSEPVESVTSLLEGSTLPVALLFYAAVSTVLVSAARARDASTSWRSLRFWFQPPLVARLGFFVLCAVLTVGFAPPCSVPFIYFQF